MDWINAILAWISVVALAPVQSWSPAVVLVLLSVVAGVVMTVVFRYSSDQQGLKRVARLTKAQLMCLRIFKEDLGGHPLLSNKSLWVNFVVISNRHWHHNNLVLIGDALRTVHFSIGSGTRTALEDAIALSRAFERQGDNVQAALQEFEKSRKPPGSQLSEVAHKSLMWLRKF